MDVVNQNVDRLTREAGRLEPTGVPHPPLLAFKHIVVAIDGSAASKHALAWARELALAFRSRVDIVNVAPPRLLFDHYSEWAAAPISPVASYERSERKANELVRRAEARLVRAGVQAEGVVLVGFPTDEIPRYVRSQGADLLIVGSNPRGPIDRLVLGHIADAVKAEVPCAVLIAKTPPAKERLVAAVDGSHSSKRAAVMAIRLAHLWKGHAWVVHVVEPPTFDLGESALRSLRSLDLSNAPRDNDPRVDYEIEFGRAADRVVRFAHRKRAGMIVVGSRGLTGLRSRFLGSVSNRVAHRARSSVLVLKDPEG